MEARTITWTVDIVDIATQLRVGIWEHERAPQPIRITLSMRATAPAFPRTIEDCLNYQPICRWITDDWPQQAHTPLLETRVRELMSFVFDYDDRIEWVDLAISKPVAISAATGVGIRMALSRSDYEANFRPTIRNSLKKYSIPASENISID
jgi:dihydroneopterin aldolase